MTYADVFASQPFRNQLVTLTLTGKQIKDMLEQQWLDPKRPRILQVSKGFSYAWDGAKPDGERVIAERMTLNGQTDRSRRELSRHREQFSRRSAATASPSSRREPRRKSASTTSTRCTRYFRANSPIAPAPRWIASCG